MGEAVGNHLCEYCIVQGSTVRLQFPAHRPEQRSLPTEPPEILPARSVQYRGEVLYQKGVVPEPTGCGHEEYAAPTGAHATLEAVRTIERSDPNAIQVHLVTVELHGFFIRQEHYFELTCIILWLDIGSPFLVHVLAHFYIGFWLAHT
jgi:hypothetical protein